MEVQIAIAMMIIVQIALAITETHTVVCVGTLTTVQMKIVTNVRLPIVSLANVPAVLHSTSAVCAPLVVHVFVTGPLVTLPAIIDMILLRGSLAGIIQPEVLTPLPIMMIHLLNVEDSCLADYMPAQKRIDVLLLVE